MGFMGIVCQAGGVPEWLKGADCKSVGAAYAGLNPASPTNGGLMRNLMMAAPSRILLV